MARERGLNGIKQRWEFGEKGRGSGRMIVSVNDQDTKFGRWRRIQTKRQEFEGRGRRNGVGKKRNR